MPNEEQGLCDSGPIVALFDKTDAAHKDCQTALKEFPGRLITTWPVLTEAFHFLEGTRERQALWEFLLSGALTWTDIQRVELARMNTLMMKYADLPMDLADASLVVVAERLKLRKVFTLDRRDFRLYRPRHTRAFEIFP